MNLTLKLAMKCTDGNPEIIVPHLLTVCSGFSDTLWLLVTVFKSHHISELKHWLPVCKLFCCFVIIIYVFLFFIFFIFFTFCFSFFQSILSMRWKPCSGGSIISTNNFTFKMIEILSVQYQGLVILQSVEMFYLFLHFTIDSEDDVRNIFRY